MMRADSIRNTIAERATELHERFAVKSLSLFGSAGRGQLEPGSDVDLLVEFDGPATFDGFMDLKFYLEDLLGQSVDLVTPKALKPRMRPTVQREAVRVA